MELVHGSFTVAELAKAGAKVVNGQLVIPSDGGNISAKVISYTKGEPTLWAGINPDHWASAGKAKAIGLLPTVDGFGASAVITVGKAKVTVNGRSTRLMAILERLNPKAPTTAKAKVTDGATDLAAILGTAPKAPKAPRTAKAKAPKVTAPKAGPTDGPTAPTVAEPAPTTDGPTDGPTA